MRVWVCVAVCAGVGGCGCLWVWVWAGVAVCAGVGGVEVWLCVRVWVVGWLGGWVGVRLGCVIRAAAAQPRRGCTRDAVHPRCAWEVGLRGTEDEVPGSV